VKEIIKKIDENPEEKYFAELGRYVYYNLPEVDHREDMKMKEMMIQQGWKVVEISAGDYSISVDGNSIVMVERKADDFLIGIMNKSLLLQLKRMYEENPDAIHHLLIVDKTLTQILAQAIKHDMTVNQIIGFIGSLISRGFYPIFTGSTQMTSRILESIRRKVYEMESDELHKPVYNKIKIGGETIIIFPGINEKLGKLLVDRFGSIENLCKQDIYTLTSVPGIGTKKAENIYKYLHGGNIPR
jgi:ERCC4-type nuclease